MGLLNQIESLFGGGNASGSASLLNAARQLLTSQQGGGLSGLLQKLEQGGLGEAVKSWVSNGPNQSVTADAIHKALGSDAVAKIAQQAGISPQAVAGGLANVLPHLINHVTPNGTVPNTASIENALQGLLGKLGAG